MNHPADAKITRSLDHIQRAMYVGIDVARGRQIAVGDGTKVAR